MERRGISKEKVREMMQYDRSSLLREPPQFDCPPPSFEINDGKKPWITMAEAIILPNGFE